MRKPQFTFEFYFKWYLGPLIWNLLHFVELEFPQNMYQLQNDNFAGDKESSKDFLEGQVVQCLESKFIADAEKISPQCKHELEISVQDEAMDYR